ncbi:hypothetical protein VTO73DRAFT_7222 [Trametes versicolor]
MAPSREDALWQLSDNGRGIRYKPLPADPYRDALRAHRLSRRVISHTQEPVVKKAFDNRGKERQHREQSSPARNVNPLVSTDDVRTMLKYLCLRDQPESSAIDPYHTISAYTPAGISAALGPTHDQVVYPAQYDNGVDNSGIDYSQAYYIGATQSQSPPKAASSLAHAVSGTEHCAGTEDRAGIEDPTEAENRIGTEEVSGAENRAASSSGTIQQFSRWLEMPMMYRS